MDADVNAQYYGALKPGQRDYWRYMAAPRWRMATALSLLSSAPPGCVADLGCGDGSLLSIVRRYFPKTTLVGIDLSPEQIDANRKTNPSISWHVVDLNSSAPLPSELRGLCDTVLAMEVIEHLKDPRQLLIHAHQLLRPGGRFILSTQSGPVRETEKRVGHQRHFSAVEMTDLLMSTGWRPVRVWNSGWPFHDLAKWVANLSPNRTMNHFGEGAYSWRQKIVCFCLQLVFKLNSSARGAQLFVLAEKQ